MVKLDHLTLSVRDHEISREWYTRNLSLAVEFEVPGRRAVAVRDDADFTLFLDESHPGGTASCVLYFQVDSVAAKHAELSARGVGFIHPPSKQYWGYGAELADPDGYRVRLWDAASMREKGETRNTP
jgi:catechol 2,3-dioxygenase-like lactoylglutathione lyase family enzyme